MLIILMSKVKNLRDDRRLIYNYVTKVYVIAFFLNMEEIFTEFSHADFKSLIWRFQVGDESINALKCS